MNEYDGVGAEEKTISETTNVHNSIENLKKAVPRSTMYKNRWGVRICEEWQAERENKLVMSEDNPFSLDFSDTTDEELHKLLSEYDWFEFEFDNHVQRNIAPEQLMHVVE